MSPIRIATRKSPLALWQAEYVAAQLQAAHPGLEVTLLPMSTKGDRILDAPLAKIGGKGLFVKELEQAMLEGRADLAVHSMKDVPMAFPDGLQLQTILKRASPFDAFVSNHYAQVDALPQGAVVGTSSLRRQCQLQAQRPDLQIRSLRGNVNTRLAKLDAGEFDAIILAESGLRRLGMAARIRTAVAPEQILPAVGQGALGIECRSADAELHALLAPLSDAASTYTVSAERAMNNRLQGGCQVPIGSFALLEGQTLWLRGLVGAIDGSQILYAEAKGDVHDAEALGIAVAEQLLEQGAGVLLAAVSEH